MPLFIGKKIDIPLLTAQGNAFVLLPVQRDNDPHIFVNIMIKLQHD